MTKAKPLPPIERLRELLRYDTLTGDLIWLRRENCPNWAWNTKHAGKRAGRIDSGGYLRVGIDGSPYAVHRIVWALHHGEPDPLMEIDHRNHVRTDNRIENLRLTTKNQNQWNQKPRAGTTSRFKGVIWNRRDRRWQAQISFNGVHRNLGYFHDEIEAARAYDAAAWSLMGEHARLNGV